MASRARPTSPTLPAGFVKREGPLEATGRYVDGNWVRFINDRPEKMKGWTRYTRAAFIGYARGAHTWNDLTSKTETAFGTAERLYFIDSGLRPQDITPLEDVAGVVLTTAFATVNASNVVTVTHAAHGKVVGQSFDVISVPVGGLTLAGTYIIATVPTADTYTFLAAAAATSTDTSVGTATVYYVIRPGPNDPAFGYGWGVGPYGDDTWGTPRASSEILIEPRYWSLDHFGKLLLASPSFGKLYQFDPTITIARATPVAPAEAPGAMRSFFVTPERFVIALGCSPDTGIVVDNLLMRWCTQGDFTIWTPALTNTANTRRVTRGKKLVAGTATGSTLSLIWTDTALYAHQYTGSSFVFDTRLAGINCGLSGPMAFTLARGSIYWMSPSGFHVYNGGVSKIPNADHIAEWVFAQTRANYEIKTFAFFHERYDEVWFVFVTEGQTEPSIYATFSIAGNHWVTGTLRRTSWTAIQKSNSNPILAGVDGYFYQHDVGLDGNGEVIDSYVTAAPFEIGNGEQEYDLFGFMGDWGRQTGAVTLELSTYNRSNEAVIESAIHTLAPGLGIEDIHLAGRMVAFTIRSSVLGGDFRLGAFKFEVRPAGMKR